VSRFLRSRGFDVLIVVAAIGGALEVALQPEDDTATWFAAPALALTVLPLLARRRFPFAAPAAVWLVAGAISFVDGSLPAAHASVFAAGMAAAFLLGSLPDAGRGRAGLAVVVAGIAIVIYNDPAQSPGEFVFTPALFTIAWLVGFALRERAAQVRAAEERATDAEREREANARRAVFEERVRIARELHDVIAHHVSMMGVQAGAGRLVIDQDPAKAKEALAAIELSSRHAVQELYRLLGFLRQAGDPDPMASQPGLGQLQSLAAGMSNAELTVEVSVEGEERALPATVDVSAYRIVQEALTNTLKHSGASRAAVRLRYRPDEFEVEIVDDGRLTDTPVAPSGGLGLIGMRERAALHGGQLSAGPATGGGFAVRVKLPTPHGAL
jgi:signal transduction histidine kinase